MTCCDAALCLLCLRRHPDKHDMGSVSAPVQALALAWSGRDSLHCNVRPLPLSGSRTRGGVSGQRLSLQKTTLIYKGGLRKSPRPPADPAADLPGFPAHCLGMLASWPWHEFEIPLIATNESTGMYTRFAADMTHLCSLPRHAHLTCTAYKSCCKYTCYVSLYLHQYCCACTPTHALTS